METKKNKSRYAVFAETNTDDMETWLTFIEINGNEEHLSILSNQLDEIDWSAAPEYTGMFVIDTKGVSLSTARDMMFVNLNTRYDPNKFDGRMKKIDFGFEKRDSDETKAVKVYELIGEGNICNFLGREDLEGCSLKESDDEDYSDESDDEIRRRPRGTGSLDLNELPAILGKAYNKKK
tara:strand:- start:1722 stop:2258 length:537 start_codon:yes stop_codon:yes gene_type:complete